MPCLEPQVGVYDVTEAGARVLLPGAADHTLLELLSVLIGDTESAAPPRHELERSHVIDVAATRPASHRPTSSESSEPHGSVDPWGSSSGSADTVGDVETSRRRGCQSQTAEADLERVGSGGQGPGEEGETDQPDQGPVECACCG